MFFGPDSNQDSDQDSEGSSKPIATEELDLVLKAIEALVSPLVFFANSIPKADLAIPKPAYSTNLEQRPYWDQIGGLFPLLFDQGAKILEVPSILLQEDKEGRPLDDRTEEGTCRREDTREEVLGNLEEARKEGSLEAYPIEEDIHKEGSTSEELLWHLDLQVLEDKDNRVEEDIQVGTYGEGSLEEVL